MVEKCWLAILIVKAIVSVVVRFVHRSNVSTKLTTIEGERILFAGKTPCLTMHLTTGTNYIVIKMKNWPCTVAPFTRSVMAAAQK